MPRNIRGDGQSSEGQQPSFSEDQQNCWLGSFQIGLCRHLLAWRCCIQAECAYSKRWDPPVGPAALQKEENKVQIHRLSGVRAGRRASVLEKGEGCREGGQR